MPSGAKKRKAAKKKNNKDKDNKGGGGGGPNNNNNPPNNTTNYPSSQGEDDSKSQEDRESDTGSTFSQEKNDHEQHPFGEESERSDTPSVASDLTGSQLSNAEDPAGGNIVVEDDERLVEVNILNSGAVNGSATSEQKQEEDPSYALSTKASSGIQEKALRSLATVESHILEVGKAVADDNGGLRVESVPTETDGFEQVVPPVEVDKSLRSSVDVDYEEKGIEDAVSLDIEEKDVNSSFGEGSAQILIAERSAEDANGDVDVNPASKVDWDTPVVPISDMENSLIDSVHSVEVLEVVECRLSDNEDKELQEPIKDNGPTVKGMDGKEGKVFPSEEDNVETSLDEGKTLTSANEVFPLVDENGKTSPDEVDAVIENEDKVLIVTEEKEDGSIPAVDDMIESSTVAASATEIANEAKTKAPGAGSVDNVSTVEASDVAVRENEGTLLKSTDSGTEKAGIDKNKKDSSVSAGTQHPVARATGLWALVMSCFGVSNR